MWRFNSAPEGSAAPLTCAASGHSPCAPAFGLWRAAMGTCRAVSAAPRSAHPSPRPARGVSFSPQQSGAHKVRCQNPLGSLQHVSCLLALGQCTQSRLWPRSSCCQLCSGLGFACFSHVCQCGVWVVLFHWFWSLWECTQQD